MKKLISLLAAPLIACAVITLATGGSAASQGRHGTAAPAGPAIAATNRLALGLLPRLGGTGNVVFSPYSIATALAMVDQGAAGRTAAELGSVLGSTDPSLLGASETRLARRLRAAVSLPSGLPRTDASHLTFANGLWVDSGLKLRSPFQTALAQDFGAAPQTAGFHQAPEPARQAINSWIAQHTGRLIRNLFQPGSIDRMTRLVLANAIYLKAYWQNPFVMRSTRLGPFVTGTGTTVQAPFMTQPATEFGYAAGSDYRAIDLPYLENSLSMLIVMPTPRTLPGFQSHLSRQSLAGILRAMTERIVELRMPRFKLGLRTSLNPVLSALGMPIAFSHSADFSGITRRAAVKIAEVVHAATLKVDEHGTVAAAATGITLAGAGRPVNAPVVHLTLDHPFLLFLRDDSTGAILFAGRLEDPTGS
jgi:serpin B